MEHDLNVYGDFDGGNPQEPGSIVRLAEDEFAVYPFSEGRTSSGWVSL